MSAAERLRDAGRRLWRRLFPPEIELPSGARRVLAGVLPALDLGRVSFHHGMPLLMGGDNASAITLPSPLSRRTRIYVDPRHWAPESAEGLGTLIHEAYHALQAQESGRGLGPFHPFLVLYFAASAANGFRYRGHPMEEAAYRLAGRRHSLFESTFPDWQGDFAILEEPCRGLAAPESGLRFWRDLARSAPLGGRLPVALWLLLWSGAVAVVWLGWLLVVGVGAVAAGALWGLGACLSWCGELARRRIR
jgi:hypothetical protein